MAISLERAKAQAAEFGHSVRREVGYLTIHSMLHLLGYDHLDEGPEKAQMRAHEEAVIRVIDSTSIKINRRENNMYSKVTFKKQNLPMPASGSHPAKKVWAATYRGIYPDEMIDQYDLERYTAKDRERLQDPKRGDLFAPGRGGMCRVFLLRRQCAGKILPVFHISAAGVSAQRNRAGHDAPGGFRLPGGRGSFVLL